MPSPMLVTPFSMVAFVKLVQKPNALLPMLVTLPGIVTLVSPVASNAAAQCW